LISPVIIAMGYYITPALVGGRTGQLIYNLFISCNAAKHFAPIRTAGSLALQRELLRHAPS
jgi:hypothetical protein